MFSSLPRGINVKVSSKISTCQLKNRYLGSKGKCHNFQEGEQSKILFSPLKILCYVQKLSEIFCLLGHSLTSYAYVRETKQACTSRVNWFPNQIISSTKEKNKKEA